MEASFSYVAIALVVVLASVLLLLLLRPATTGTLKIKNRLLFRRICPKSSLSFVSFSLAPCFFRVYEVAFLRGNLNTAGGKKANSGAQVLHCGGGGQAQLG